MLPGVEAVPEEMRMLAAGSREAEVRDGCKDGVLLAEVGKEEQLGQPRAWQGRAGSCRQRSEVGRKVVREEEAPRWGCPEPVSDARQREPGACV